MIPSATLLHAAWITAAVAVCLALCTIHSRKSSSSLRRGSSRPGPARSSTAAARTSECNGDIGAAAGATPAARVSPTPSDTSKSCCVNVGDLHEPARVGDNVMQIDASAVAGPVTVIDVGTHGPIAPVFLVPDPMPPRRSLSVKHIRFAERLEKIRSRRWGGDNDDAEAQLDDTTLWTKTILLGERCRVPSGGGDGGGGDDALGYRPRHPRSVP
ncbi:hypothetical protein CFC21_041343 [Triticum aestivum]|uniref:Uncharacterized protein n=2 Tax=Triticum aestivum TaxID=4565 RepID=A0A9R1FJM5_WHEAT|nr:hypothetical protein CFC21_041343 [Triticum aestivum]CDM83168.1 unnamed protein product [Triticum aestivum]